MTTRSPRTLGAVCAGLGLAAVLLWGASTATWFVVTVAGRAPVTFDGAQVAPSLTGLALLALAGVAGVVATGGVVRRVLGALLGLAGVAVGVIGARALLFSPFATDASGAGLPQPPSGVSVDALRYQPTETTVAPLLAVAAAVVLLLVGLAVAVRESRLPRFGARYAAPGSRPVELDPDRAAWQDLDVGRDPTVDPAGDRGDDPGPGTRPL